MKIEYHVEALRSLGCVVVVWPPESLQDLSETSLEDMTHYVQHYGDEYLSDNCQGDAVDDNECPNCNGTGEGAYEGSVCHCCGGFGDGPIQHDPDDFDIPDEDY